MKLTQEQYDEIKELICEAAYNGYAMGGELLGAFADKEGEEKGEKTVALKKETMYELKTLITVGMLNGFEMNGDTLQAIWEAGKALR